MNDIASSCFSLNVLKGKQEQNSKITEQKVGFSIHNQHKTETTSNKSEMPMRISDNPKDYRKYFSRGKESTKATNARRLKNYCVHIQKSPEQLIEEYESARQTNKLKIWERNESNTILKFYNQLLENNSINYARSCVMGVLAFHKQNTQQLPNVTLEVAPVQMASNEYRFSQDDLRKMFYYGDTEEKALLSLAVSYGQGSKEFLSLECQKLRRIINEAKDKVLAQTILRVTDLRRLREYVKILLKAEEITKSDFEGSSLIKLRGI